MVSGRKYLCHSYGDSLAFRFSETELLALRSRNEQLEVIATEQKSKSDIIDELNKDLSEKNKVRKKKRNFH